MYCVQSLCKQRSRGQPEPAENRQIRKIANLCDVAVVYPVFLNFFRQTGLCSHFTEQFCEKVFLLFYGFALETINNFHRAVSFTPVDPKGWLRAAGGHRRHQADLWAHHAVKHGQLRSDSFHALVHRDLHTTNLMTARVTCVFRIYYNQQCRGGLKLT